MNSIAEILDELRAGRMIVLVDDEQRENEGDLVCAAQFATPQVLNFMLREGRGMMCVALDGEICDQLDLHPQGQINTSTRATAYTISVDAHERFGVTTGVSAADRARTVGVLIDPEGRPRDLARPGHMHPLRARAGGVLVRAGQTEGSVDLCRLAGLRPGAVIIEVMNDDGSMARQTDLEKLCAKHSLKMCSVADIIHHRLQREKLVQRIAAAPFTNDLGQFQIIAYQSRVDPFPHLALTCGDLGALDPDGKPIEIDEPVLVRMHSQNLLGDVFGDLTQPSGQTLRQAMKMIHDAKRGAVVYLRHERTGSGLLKQLQTASLPEDHELSSNDRPHLGESQTTPGIKPPLDTGAYGIGAQILRDLGVRKIRLITNHPFTPTALSGFDLSIEQFVPVIDQ
jgi:3,4-dihydroxy 2-butanone 4-phosphate synthase/GTP cyclohydrolase II